MSTCVSMFADDTGVANLFIANIHDAINIQEHLEKIYSWTLESNMELNKMLFESVKYGRNYELKSEYKYNIPPCD